LTDKLAYYNLTAPLKPLNASIEAAKRLRNYPEPKADASLNNEISSGISDPTELQNHLKSVLAFQVGVTVHLENYPSLASLNCAQLQDYLVKIQLNISTNQNQFGTFESLKSKYSGRIENFNQKLLTSTGNYTIIYNELNTIYFSLHEIAIGTLTNIVNFLAMLETVDEPVQREILNRCPNLKPPTASSDIFDNEMTENEAFYIGGFPVSKNGLYEMVLLSDGNVVTRSRTTGEVVWSAGTTGQGGVKVVLQSNGVLALLNENEDVLLSTEPYSTPIPGSKLTLLNNGHFIIHKGNQIAYGSQIGAPNCGKIFIREREPNFDTHFKLNLIK
jgi:hypothetical protein